MRVSDVKCWVAVFEGYAIYKLLIRVNGQLFVTGSVQFESDASELWLAEETDRMADSVADMVSEHFGTEVLPSRIHKAIKQPLVIAATNAIEFREYEINNGDGIRAKIAKYKSERAA